MQSFTCPAADSGRFALVLVAFLCLIGCRDQTQTQATSDAVVRPASGEPAQAEAPAEPERPAAPAEIPRGVSPPELTAEEAAVQAKPASEPDVAEAPRSAAKAGLAAPARAAAEPKPVTPVIAEPKQTSKPAAAPRPQRAATAQKRAKSTRPVVQEPPPAAAQPVVEPPVQQPVAAAPKRASVQVPSTDHVRVDVPQGLQAWLDADDRMRPWLSKAVSTADGCYAKLLADDPNAAGDIAVQVIMHENARPSGRVSSVASAVNGVVMCATTRLLGVKMPLFTGNEGDTYTVRVHFSP